MPAAWLTTLSWWAIVAGVTSAAWIVVDTFLAGNRQRMWIMEVVWPITALYMGPVAVLAYRKWGLPSSPHWCRLHRNGRPEGADRPLGVAAALGTMHCGGGCTLGDLLGAWVVFALGLSIGGHAVWSEFLVDFAFAYGLGVLFQYFTIAPMRGLNVRKGLIAAVKADTLSLAAFEVGMFGWMAVVQLAFFPSGLAPDHAAYWFLMQIGMLLGYATSYPANRWLLRRGLKEAM